MITECRAVWIYALLARLEKPLNASSMACIRDLFRLASTARQNAYTTACELGSGNFRKTAHSSSVNVNGALVAPTQCSNLATLNLLILVAHKYFGQGGA